VPRYHDGISMHCDTALPFDAAVIIWNPLIPIVLQCRISSASMRVSCVSIRALTHACVCARKVAVYVDT
jgi:hypothetical protein